MLSGKLIGNRKERSSTYQLFTQGSLGFFSEFSLANIFKCLPIQRMEYTEAPASCSSRELEKAKLWLPRGLMNLSIRKRYPLPPKMPAVGFTLCWTSTFRNYGKRTRSPSYIVQMSRQPEVVLFRALLPDWWQLASQQCQTSRNWFVHIIWTYNT